MLDPSPKVAIPRAPGVYVIADGDGRLFVVPDRAGGWRHRSAYQGSDAELIECSPRVAGAIAQRLGAARAARNPRGGRPGAPPPPALRSPAAGSVAPDPVGAALAAYQDAERSLEDALAALRSAQGVVEVARRRFADAVRFLQVPGNGP